MMGRRETNPAWRVAERIVETLFGPLTKERRERKEAKLLLREARRVIRRYRHRADDKHVEEVRQSVDELEAALKNHDAESVTRTLNALDKRLDERFSYARKSTLREYGESIGVAVLIALFLRAFVVEAFKIPSGSMIPTLQVGDHIFVNKFIYGIRIPYTDIKFGADYRKPKRGEVIVFIYPVEPDKDFIKRIVAVEGDTVEIKDNVVWVNDHPVPRDKADDDCSYEDYNERADQWEERRCEGYTEKVPGNEYTTIYNREAGPSQSWPKLTVPPNSVYVMGDNRDNSHDSRFWGFVPLSKIKGKAMVIWWSSGDGTLNGIRFGRMFHLVK